MCRAPLQAVQAVAIEAVMPIFKAMVEAAEEIILRLHSEGFADEGQQGMTQASAYMQALTTHLTHCRSLLCLSSLVPPTSLTAGHCSVSHHLSLPPHSLQVTPLKDKSLCGKEKNNYSFQGS